MGVYALVAPCHNLVIFSNDWAPGMEINRWKHKAPEQLHLTPNGSNLREFSVPNGNLG